MTTTLRSLRIEADKVAAPGTDPDELAAVVAWASRPRNHPDQLRRRLRDAADPADGRSVARTVASLAGKPTSEDAVGAAPLLLAWRQVGVRVALIGDQTYPPGLSEGWPSLDPPVWLAWRGSAPGAGDGVAIVGSRRASGYGVAIAAWLAQAAAGAGLRVVSGGARGVDAAAHEAACRMVGCTTVVLGCGHRVAYPRPHAQQGGLFDRILDAGGTLVSEALPHEPPRAYQIRARNRILAGLARAVVVVEGGERSGALLTAGAAADRGRPVLAVPGDVRAPGSVAPHRLLAEGAAPICSPEQLLEALSVSAAAGLPSESNERATGQLPGILPPQVHAVLAAVWPRPMPLEVLAERSGLPIAELLACLTRAQVGGVVGQGADGIRLRRPPAGPA